MHTPENQYMAGQDQTRITYGIKFKEISVYHVPKIFEADGDGRELFPHEARLRSLTYATAMWINVSCKEFDTDNIPSKDELENIFDNDEEPRREFLGYMPIMLRSQYCILQSMTNENLMKVGECIFDKGGYFVINGSEKVIIAQERMSNNHVYVFKKKQPHKFEWVCETRSHILKGSRPTSTIFLQMYGKGPKN